MSTFAELVNKPGCGMAYYFAVSFDHITFPYYFGTTWLPHVGAEPRIQDMSSLARGFAVDHGMSASSMTVTLDNTDGALDWISNRDTWVTQTVRSQWQLIAYAFNEQNPSDFATKPLGFFTTLNPPSRNGSSIILQLVDNSLGDLQLCAIPTVRDWINITDVNRPPFLTAVANQQLDPSIAGNVRGFDIDAPAPLMFGTDAHVITRVQRNCYLVCAVLGPGTGIPGSPVDYVVFGNGQSCAPARTFPAGGSVPIWTAYRTPDITKAGRTWHLIWLNLNLTNDDPAVDVDAHIVTMYLRALGYSNPNTQTNNGLFNIHEIVAPVSIRAKLLSHTTNDITTLSTGINAATLVKELATNYSLTPPTIDVASFNAVKDGRPEATASGSLQQGVSNATTTLGDSFFELIDGEMSSAIRSLCSLGNFDVFMSWSGAFTASAPINNFTAQTATLARLDETLVDDSISEKIPGAGERNQPFNRLFVMQGDTRWGPVDNAAAITAWGKVITRQIDGTWMWLQLWASIGQVRVNPGQLARTDTVTFAQEAPDLVARFKNLDGATVRPTVSARTWMNGLNFELGDMIMFSWSRGILGGPYIDTIFRVEEIVVEFMSGHVSLELSWWGELRTTGKTPYILDDETLLTRATGSGGRTITLTTGSSTVLFSSGNLLVDGVAAGDHLIVTDATEGTTGFARNVALYVASVTDATHLVISAVYSSNAFGAGGPFVISTWELRRGALNYRANAAAYGKVGDSTHPGFFSDNATKDYLLLDG